MRTRPRRRLKRWIWAERIGMSTGRVSGKSKPRGEALFEDEDDDEDDYEPEEIREKGWSDAIAEAYVVSADRDGL